MQIAMLLMMACVSAQTSPAAPAFTNVEIKVTLNTNGKVNHEQVVVALIPNKPLDLYNAAKIIKQSNAQFRPFITVAHPGSMIEFPNFDDFAHHVYSFSPTMSFELPLYSGDHEQQLVVDKTGIVPIGCNIHDWMLAYIVVIESPYFTFLKDDVARFSSVPAGDYEVSIWHPSMDDFWTQPVVVDPSNAKLAVILPTTLNPVTQLPAPDLEDMDQEDY